MAVTIDKLRENTQYYYWLTGTYMLYTLRHGIHRVGDDLIQKFARDFKESYRIAQHGLLPCKRIDNCGNCWAFLTFVAGRDRTNTHPKVYQRNVGHNFGVVQDRADGTFIAHQLAKIFMGEGVGKMGKDEEFDCAQYLKFLARCKDVPFSDTVKDLMESIIEIRNKIFHAAGYTIPKQYLDSLYGHMRNLLNVDSIKELDEENLCLDAWGQIDKVYKANYTTDTDLDSVIQMETIAFTQVIERFETDVNQALESYQSSLVKTVDAKLSPERGTNGRIAVLEQDLRKFKKCLEEWICQNIGTIKDPECVAVCGSRAEKYTPIRDIVKSNKENAARLRNTAGALAERVKDARVKEQALGKNVNESAEAAATSKNKLARVKHEIIRFKTYTRWYEGMKTDIEEAKKVCKNYQRTTDKVDALAQEMTNDFAKLPEGKIKNFAELEDGLKSDMQRLFLIKSERPQLDDIEKGLQKIKEWFGVEALSNLLDDPDTKHRLTYQLTKARTDIEDLEPKKCDRSQVSCSPSNDSIRSVEDTEDRPGLSGGKSANSSSPDKKGNSGLINYCKSFFM